jgi:6-phosphogluconate dehydrogenase
VAGSVGPLTGADAEAFAASVEQALYASKIVSYTQGFDQIRAGSDEYGWDIHPGAVAAIWRGGCIIRAAFLDRITAAFDGRPDLPGLLSDQRFAAEIGAAQDDWRAVVAEAVRRGVPVPGFSAALAYYDALRAERLPAALTQGQRDFFGAHTYKRTDMDGTFHTLWSGDRSEVESAGSSH